jgi:hypothetical protein
VATFLALCNALHREVNAGPGDMPGSLPTTVVSQSGFPLRIVNWIADSWTEIQGQDRDWRWMLRQSTITTVSGTQDYSLETTLTSQTAVAVTSITRSGSTATVTTTAPHGFPTDYWVLHAGAGQAEYNVVARITVTGASTYTFTVSGTPATPATGTITAQLIDYDEIRPFQAQYRDPYILLTAPAATVQQRVYYMPWQHFGGHYNQTQLVATSAQPVWFTIKPDGKLALYPEPDAAYVLTIPYRKIPQVLSFDAQIPEMPAKHHMAIVYYALVHYGAMDESTRQIVVRDTLYRPKMTTLRNEQLGTPTVYGAA